MLNCLSFAFQITEIHDAMEFLHIEVERGEEDARDDDRERRRRDREWRREEERVRMRAPVRGRRVEDERPEEENVVQPRPLPRQPLRQPPGRPS